MPARRQVNQPPAARFAPGAPGAAPAKKARPDGASAAAAAPLAAPASGPLAPAVPQPNPDAPKWVNTCRALVRYLIDKVLGPRFSAIFYNPVNTTALTVYAQHCPSPISFSEILARLEGGQYAGPADFYADVCLLCDNCYAYNVVAFPSDFGRVGLTMEHAFLRAWASDAELAGAAPPRAARPMPAHLAAVPKKPARSASYGGGAPRAAPGRGGAWGAPPGPGRGRGRGRPPGSGAGRGRGRGSLFAQPLPQAKQVALADAMADPAVMDAKMEGVVRILQDAGELPTNDDGEVELDLAVLSAPTTWKLWEYVLGAGAGGGGGGGGGGYAAPGAGGAGEPSAEDSDYEPGGSDDL